MTITINAQGAERKRLVNTISQWLGAEPHYCGAPSFAYDISKFTVEKDGSLTYGESVDAEVAERLLQHLYDEGFDIDMSADNTSTEEVSGTCVSMPLSIFTTQQIQNLNAIINAKGGLIKNALGVQELPIEVDEHKVYFPWFPGTPTPDELKAYDTFICKLCEFAGNLKRVTAKEKEADNEKYAFRCFLLRLGFIGDEYKRERKILLRNLEGSSAFKSAKEVNG